MATNRLSFTVSGRDLDEAMKQAHEMCRQFFGYRDYTLAQVGATVIVYDRTLDGRPVAIGFDVQFRAVAR